MNTVLTVVKVLCAVGIVALLVTATWWSVFLAGLGAILLTGFATYRADEKPSRKSSRIRSGSSSPSKKDVRARIEEVARMNIARARDERSSKGVDVFEALRATFGEEWVRGLSEKKIERMHILYQETVKDYIESEQKLSAYRDRVNGIGTSEQPQLVAFFEGREELQNDGSRR